MNTIPYICSMLGLVALPLHAQILVDKPIELQGAVRRVEGLAPSTAPNDALTAGIAQRGPIHYATPVAATPWAVESDALGGTLANGTYLVIRVPASEDMPVAIAVNGADPLPVLHEGVPLVGTAMAEGHMLSVVYGDGAFHVLNGNHDLRRNCPSGMVAVNDLYCIEPNERGSGDYFQSGLACAAVGRRLCTWGEFIGACQRSLALQLSGMTNSWEWTNSTANEDNVGRIAGLNGCESAGTWLSTGNAPVPYRCCFSR